MKTKNMLPMTEEILPLTKQESGYLTGGFKDESIDPASLVDPSSAELGNFLCPPINVVCTNKNCHTFNYSEMTCKP